MTAKTSAHISIGSKIPVDAFSPKTKARIITIIIPIPLIPDLDKPNKKTANPIAIHCNAVK